MTPRGWCASNWRFTSRRRGGVLFSLEIVDESAGMIVLRVTGPAAWELFRHESGGHRWQRVPPNERRGKVHSSTVTVAVFQDVTAARFAIRESDLLITTCRGSGPGGQKRNKTESAVQVKHVPTGLAVRCETERSQSQNKASAIALLTARLSAMNDATLVQSQCDSRRRQIGTGERSDKVRTVQMQNNLVINHLTGDKLPAEQYLKGDLSGII
jgi:peptide chain release factor 1